ncbi:serine carboxypeptidase-like 45 isoform X1 [Neltuma alba]|uniref:serine carboxypeptidase-like 45 isoform X1 n=1 Tax=Neltuma alba TaxID=207710 RepID=UPI0010A2F1CD|nr:serine carboxypeptidase-like 45 isoform X1 [Prosopis alba]
MLSQTWNWLAIVCAIFVLTYPMAESYPREDEIQSLPGQPPVTFQQFAGYITIDDRKQRSMFYYFVEAETNPTSKPLVLWLNGGPGCSSLIGAFFEHGPFTVSAKGIVKNKYSWNKVANMLYLESPAGVGFSYSVNKSIYASYNDEIIARDNLAFLQCWFAKFPKYKNRYLFITGESYGGHYVPQLAQLIIQTKAIPNLKGIAIGNPLLEFENDLDSRVDHYWSHGLISDSTYNAMNKVCNGSEFAKQLIKGKMSDTCKKLHGIVQAEFVVSVNQDNILGQTCDSLNLTTAAILARPPTSIMSQLLQPYTNNRQGDGGVCGLTLVSNYLNRKGVQTALHAQIVEANTWIIVTYSSIQDIHSQARKSRPLRW